MIFKQIQTVSNLQYNNNILYLPLTNTFNILMVMSIRNQTVISYVNIVLYVLYECKFEI